MTTIKLTPPNGTQREIKIYDSCTTSLSSSDRAGSFSLSLPSFDSTLVDAFPVGSDVEIIQDDVKFRGWVISPPKSLDGVVKTLQLQGATYTAKTQKIVVTESYTNTQISDIVTDLFTKYVPWATRTNIESCTKTISISFGDSYLWDAMAQLCQISSYDWYIDEELDVNFFSSATRINSNILTPGTYAKGSANFTPDASKLVNKLWVKGGKAISEPFTQVITVGTTPIQLFYTPRSPVSVVIGGVTKTLGIQNVDAVGTKDFLLNAAEKLLIPDLCSSGEGEITYRYEYPIKLFLEDKESQATYGVFEDILKVESDDKTLAREQGLQYLAKYSAPVVTGSIQPFHGSYKPGELIKIEIPNLLINSYLQIKQVDYSSTPTQPVERKLQLESPERNAADILKDLNTRLMKLEKSVYNDSEGPVEKYNVFFDTFNPPIMEDKGISFNLHQFPVCSETLMCSENLII